MFCPKCGEQQINEDTNFCPKCGFKTEGVKIVLAKDGNIEIEPTLSQKQKGIRRGVKLILLSIILFPAYLFLNSMFPANDRLIESSPGNTWFEQIAWAVMSTIFILGIARVFYAFVFENHRKEEKFYEKSSPVENQNQINSQQQKTLPPQKEIPISDFGKWRATTGELFEQIKIRKRTSGEL